MTPSCRSSLAKFPDDFGVTVHVIPSVVRRAARPAQRVIRLPAYGTSASPHGDAPTGMRATTSSVSVSSTVTSFEGPFAV